MIRFMQDMQNIKYFTSAILSTSCNVEVLIWEELNADGIKKKQKYLEVKSFREIADIA